MPQNKDIKKVLVIGSGPIVIGQAAEFDYAGAQACRVLREAGVNIVLVNSNPATIMTDKALADEIYLEPLTCDTVKRIIQKERPDSLLASLGGQTGLTIAMQLAKEGFLEENGVKLIGTNAEAIDRAEDRELFKETMLKLGQHVIPSDIAVTVDEALSVASKIGYPVIVRPAFTLGGAGGGVAYNADELEKISGNGILLSPISQVLIEKYIYGWKEIEFEVMRDSKGNVLTVCSMENFDPVGIHTGDSIVVAPAVTLSDKEYQMLRSAALDIITELKIEGGCNCQFALDPDSFDYAVIEVNPRVSRSSALASKATGYPIAKVTTKIALGYTLDEIKNDVTGKTYACFEPTLDYIVVKMPKWPFDKFVSADRKLGTQMKATGEVMSIAPTFEQALMKAVRGAEIKTDTLHRKETQAIENIEERLHALDDLRLFTVFEALLRGISVDKIHDITRIDKWFLNKIKNLVNFERSLKSGMTHEKYIRGKQLGYTDDALSRLSGEELSEHKGFAYKMVDTCGGEFAAQTPYFYSTCDDYCEARETATENKKVIVLGSGPIRIGQGIEFDYSSVHCVWALKKLGYEVIIINNNPETVSTDFDTADRLYFEPLTPEDVMNVIDVEKPEGVVVAFGGQTAINLAKYLDEHGVKILGTSAKSIDMAEDREQFDELLERFGIRRPKGLTVMTLAEAHAAAEKLEYPVLLRPSYVIGGQNMTIAYTPDDVARYMEIILSQKIDNPVLVDKYMMGKELEVDVISDGSDVLIPGIMEHIERAGVHSGDSIAVYPPFNVNDKMLEKIVDCSVKLALSLKTRGLVNIQYLISDDELYVIEVNPRASRTVPYISKVTGIPMVDIATEVMQGMALKDIGCGTGLHPMPPYYAVKVPVFSFEKLAGINSILGPEMKSTGEVLGIGKTLNEALYKGLVSAGFNLESKTGVYISVDSKDKYDLIELAKKLDDAHLEIYADEKSAIIIEALGIRAESVEDGRIYPLLDSGKIGYIIYTNSGKPQENEKYLRLHRRALQLSVACLTSLDTANALADILLSRFNQYNTELTDITRLRTEKQKISFIKMQGTGDDYIFINNFDGSVTCPESLSILFSDRHFGIGADGLVLIEKSDVADAKMRIFNADGSEGKMAGNSIRCVGKYLYDSKTVNKPKMTIETGSGVRELELHCFNSMVNLVTVDMGKVCFEPAKIPVNLPDEKIIDRDVRIGGRPYKITCLSIGNPHCVVICSNVYNIDLKSVGPEFESAPIFPERINTEFVKIIDRKTIRMRVWERGNGETPACGTGACAAAIAAVEAGFCDKDTDISVRVDGGELTVRYTDDAVYLTGNAVKVFEGVLEY